MPAQFRATPNKLTALRSTFSGDVLKIKWLRFPGFLPFGTRKNWRTAAAISMLQKKNQVPSCLDGLNHHLVMDASTRYLDMMGTDSVLGAAWASELVLCPPHLQVPPTEPGSKVPWKIMSNSTEVHSSDGSEAIPSPQSTKPCHCFFPKVQETSDLFSFKLSVAQGAFGRN